MSIAHRAIDDEELNQATVDELYAELGENDTPKLFAQNFRLDTDHDVPDGGGNSLDRKTVYLDRALYQELMDNAFKATELTPQQIIDRWTDHEHTEKCIADGDNPCDNYLPCHRRALRKEHEGVLAILGRNNATKKIANYEAVIWPALRRCYLRTPIKPPKDLWCAPLLDDASDRDNEIISALRKLGVIDANKRAKYDVHYQLGPNNCDQCRGWEPEVVSQQHGQLASCRRISGLVRQDRSCDLWSPK